MKKEVIKGGGAILSHNPVLAISIMVNMNFMNSLKNPFMKLHYNCYKIFYNSIIYLLINMIKYHIQNLRGLCL